VPEGSDGAARARSATDRRRRRRAVPRRRSLTGANE
jgi:hypothetical protein